ncbi:MAG: MBOAT family protein [Clostridia bacterium]|nr:MBOAT family protein [Clostridia bacterium]
MNFSNLFFLYAFLPATLLLYYLIPNIHYRNAVLIFVSLIFYAWGNPTMVLLLLLVCIVNYFLGRGIGAAPGMKKGKLFLSVGLVLNIGLLFVYKYLAFFLETVNLLPKVSLPIPNIIMPLGLSFFTFRIISYLLDVYWEKVSAERSFPVFLLFVSLFPCTVAGPIVRYQTIFKCLHSRKHSREDLWYGFMRLSVGLGKKVILADQLYMVTEHYFSGSLQNLSVAEAWFALLVYTMYVYFDFSGYSDMAIGIARLFGFRFEENFRYPFVCTTISEFWQRWHISLGSFFRDYLLYVPIFGKMRIYGGLFLVWFSTGLWHGASWNYVIWGLYFGLFILLETKIGKKKMKKIPVFIRHIYTKFVIALGFGIFYFTDLSRMGVFFKCLFGLDGNGLIHEFSSVYMMNHLILVLISLLCIFPWVPFFKKKLERHTATIAVGECVCGILLLALFILSSIILVSSTNQPFLYTQF